MRYAVLAVDYDGTIATHGTVDADTLAALDRLKQSGRKLVLVTGRQVEDLLSIFPEAGLFDRIVGENGAVVYCPGDRRLDLLGEPPPAAFVDALKARGVSPLAVGHVIVATWEPQETTVLETIRDLGLELQVIFNKGAVMVLPAGVNKATGLDRALAGLQLSHHNAVGVGDAENDHAFLSRCEYTVAVANALPGLKDRADWVTAGARGEGVAEVIDRLVSADLNDVHVPRHSIALGTPPTGEPLTMSPHGGVVLIAGPSGSGKSTIATAFLEQLIRQQYQVRLVDPEGDYATLDNALALGDSHTVPTVDEVLDVLRRPLQSVTAVLLGMGPEDRPPFFDALMARLHGLQTEAGRPHWLILDEAHYFVPADASPRRSLPDPIDSVMLITVHPDQISRNVLDRVSLLIAVGPKSDETIGAFAAAAGLARPGVPVAETGDALAWFRTLPEAIRFRPEPPQGERLRHRRKYAEGTLGPDKSFYFRGPEQKLQLRAQNLAVFLQMAEGVDDETWLYHLRRGDYSSWLRESIKDDELADEVRRIESDGSSAGATRGAIAEAIGRRYTAPASAS